VFCVATSISFKVPLCKQQNDKRKNVEAALLPQTGCKDKDFFFLSKHFNKKIILDKQYASDKY